jgi:hypothetical protein
LTAWRLVVETFPLALRQARSGFWVIIAENNARDKLWDKVINASEKALAEDPENERAKELKIDAQTEVRAKAEAEKKVNPPPAPAVSSASQGQPENEKTLTKAASTGSGGIDPNEEEVIKVLLSGGTSFVPQGKASFDTVAINELLVMVSSVQREIKATDLVISQNISRGYLASVDGLWKKAADFAGEFGERVRNAVWQVIEKQLVKILDTTIKGTILASPPSQQARERREVIKLISRIDGITNGKISACSEQDALRIGVTQFFTEGFFNNALLTEKVGDDVFLESHVPWIKDLFAKNREKSGLGSVK